MHGGGGVHLARIVGRDGAETVGHLSIVEGLTGLGVRVVFDGCDLPVGRIESSKAEVTVVVVAVGLGVVGGGLRMEDAHTEVADGHCAYLSRFEMEEGRARGVGGWGDGTDDAAAWGPPLVAHMDRDPVEAQLGHLQKAPERQRIELRRAVGTDAGAVAREAVGKGAILGEGGLTSDDGHRLDVEAVGLQAAVDRGIGRSRETFCEGDVALGRVVVDLGEEERAGVVP